MTVTLGSDSIAAFNATFFFNYNKESTWRRESTWTWIERKLASACKMDTFRSEKKSEIDVPSASNAFKFEEDIIESCALRENEGFYVWEEKYIMIFIKVEVEAIVVCFSLYNLNSESTRLSKVCKGLIYKIPGKKKFLINNV